MSNGITNVTASYQASKTYQSAAATTTVKENGKESTVSSVYEALDVSASYTLELSSSGTAAGTLTSSGKPDLDKISSMKSDLNTNINALKEMVLRLLDTQSSVHSVATDNLHKLVNKITQGGGIDELSKSEAQSLISEDGYWGVNKTAQRILDFAKALSGGDDSKFATLRSAIEKGFKQAEAVWGGKLPDISKQTYDKVMKGFDEMENAKKTAETGAAASE